MEDLLYFSPPFFPPILRRKQSSSGINKNRGQEEEPGKRLQGGERLQAVASEASLITSQCGIHIKVGVSDFISILQTSCKEVRKVSLYHPENLDATSRNTLLNDSAEAVAEKASFPLVTTMELTV